MNTIVLGSNHNNTLGLVWSLAEGGHTVILLLYKQGLNYVAKSKYVKKVYYIEKNKDDVIALLKQVSHSLGSKPMVFVSSDNDAAMLNEHFAEISPYCYFEGGYADGSINCYRDKDTGNRLALKCGFTIPKNIVLENKKQIKELPISHPIIIKANNSINGGKSAMQKCDTIEESILFVDGLPGEFFPLQVQEFIEKDYEIMLLACSLESGEKVICPIANRKIRQYPMPTGMGSYSESIAVSNNVDLQKLSTMTAKYLREIHYTGLFSAEFLYCKGQYYFLEINLRNDGTSWLSTCSGFNLPDIICRSIDGNPSQEYLFNKKFYINIFADIHYVKDGTITIYKWLKLFNSQTCYSHLNFKDICPFIFCILERFKNLLTK